jgi:hypothetical protein
LFEEDVLPPQIQHGIWLAVLRDGLAHGYTTTTDEIPPTPSLSVRL